MIENDAKKFIEMINIMVKSLEFDNKKLGYEDYILKNS